MQAQANIKKAVIACAVGHTLLLACYTFPAQVVPTRLRYWSQAYARVLFHQDWRLFAPDPPACGCSVEVKSTPEGSWQRLEDGHHHFIWRRMSANACRYAEASMQPGDTVITAPIALALSLERMAEAFPRKGDLDARVHRACNREEFIWIHLQPHR